MKIAKSQISFQRLPDVFYISDEIVKKSPFIYFYLNGVKIGYINEKFKSCDVRNLSNSIYNKHGPGNQVILFHDL